MLPIQSVARKIMIVDDTPANLKLLEDILRERGYEVRSFPRGRLALAAIDEVQPDVILLDINMPEMDGYEVCRALKQSPVHSKIPVIFISALGETHDKLQAFETGGVDYLTKPFQVEEVLARVDAHLRLHHLQKELESHNQRLEAAVAKRTRELAAANERLLALDESKNVFLSLISHELRTPLNGLFGAGELLVASMEPTAENEEIETIFRESADRLMGMVDDAMLLTNLAMNQNSRAKVPLEMGIALLTAIDTVRPIAAQRNIQIEMNASPTPLQGSFDPALFQRAMVALLETAVKFAQGGVSVSACSMDRQIHVEIQVLGSSMPDAVLPSFYELLGVSEADTSAGHIGLHPMLARRIFRLFGGDTYVVNTPTGITLRAVLDGAA